MSNVRAPQFLVDIVSDLRDRRLLLPAGVLLLAVLAVPFLLSSSTEPPPAPPVSEAAALAGSEEVQPAVLAETVTVRDYRKRLDELKSSNPFDSGFQAPPGAAAAAAGLDDLVPAGGSPPTTGGGASPISTDSNVAPDTGSSSTSTSTSSGSSGGGGGGSSRPEIRYFAYEIDVKVGQSGDLSKRSGVEDLTVLPNNSNPVVMFLGASQDGKKAVFLVSEDVGSTSGDGACVPSGSNCDFLTMREGDARTFDYIPNGETYKLVLKKIKAVELNKAPDTQAP
jgi:hypothetical protein